MHSLLFSTKKFLPRFLASRILSILLLILSSACTKENKSIKNIEHITTQKDNKNTLKILAIGDSLTAGYGVSEDQSYPKLLEKKLNDSKTPVIITNAGVSGNTSAQILNRLEWILSQDNYDVVLLCSGANDGLRRLSIESLYTNLENTVKLIKERNIRVFLLGMKIPTNFSIKYRKEFENTYQVLQKKYDLPFFEFLLKDVVTKPEYNLEDMIHPNPKGYEIIAQNLYDFLKPLLRSH